MEPRSDYINENKIQLALINFLIERWFQLLDEGYITSINEQVKIVIKIIKELAISCEIDKEAKEVDILLESMLSVFQKDIVDIANNSNEASIFYPYVMNDKFDGYLIKEDIIDKLILKNLSSHCNVSISDHLTGKVCFDVSDELIEILVYKGDFSEYEINYRNDCTMDYNFFEYGKSNYGDTHWCAMATLSWYSKSVINIKCRNLFVKMAFKNKISISCAKKICEIINDDWRSYVLVCYYIIKNKYEFKNSNIDFDNQIENVVTYLKKSAAIREIDKPEINNIARIILSNI